MNNWYFYLEQGRATGPFSHQEVEEAIAAGKIGPFDLIFRDGDEKWLPGYEFGEFRTFFKNPVKAEIEENWVVLRKSQTDLGVTYLQRGPFSGEKVRELLKSGEIEYRDFIWKEGQHKWRRISSVEIFNPPVVKWQSKNPLPQDIVESEIEDPDLLDVALQEHAQPLEDSMPKEAGTEDLVSQTKTDVSMVRRAPRTPQQPEHFKERRKRPPVEIPVEEDLSFLKRIPLMPITLGIAVIALFILTFMHREEISQRLGWRWLEPARQVVKEEKRSKPAQTPQPKPVAASPVVPSPVPEPPPPPKPRVEPTRLKVVFDSEKQRLIFQTDASHHFAIKTRIVGNAGEVLEKVSVFREAIVRRDPGEEFSLSVQGLGNGLYQVEAELEKFKSEVRFRVGRKNSEFERDLAKHRKLISLPYQRERRRLIRASAALVQLADNLVNTRGAPSVGWERDMNRWRSERFDGVDIRRPQSLVFPELWQELAQKHSELQKAEGAERAQLKGQVQRIKSRIVSLSLFE